MFSKVSVEKTLLIFMLALLLPKSDGDIIQREILDPGPVLPFFPIVNYLFFFCQNRDCKADTMKLIRVGIRRLKKNMSGH